MGEFNIEEYTNRQTFMRLTQIAEQPAKQFMSGQATTAFATANTMAAGVNNVMNATEVVLNTDYSELITTLSQATWQYVKDDLSNYAKEEISYLTEKALTLPSYLAKRTTYWTKYWTPIKIKDATDTVNNDQIEKEEKEKEEQNKNDSNEKIKNFKLKTTAINEKINFVTTNIYSYITAVTNYITTGPEWLQQNLQKTITKTVNPVKNSIHKEITDEYYNLLNFIDNKANEAGEALAQKTADKTKDTLLKAKTKADKLKKTAISFAKSALQLIKQKAMALIGA